jgi:hypothetical protein
MHNLNCGKSWATSEIFKKQPKVNYSPNLSLWFENQFFVNCPLEPVLLDVLSPGDVRRRSGCRAMRRLSDDMTSCDVWHRPPPMQQDVRGRAAVVARIWPAVDHRWALRSGEVSSLLYTKNDFLMFTYRTTFKPATCVCYICRVFFHSTRKCLSFKTL